jgi:hypothetical protein
MIAFIGTPKAPVDPLLAMLPSRFDHKPKMKMRAVYLNRLDNHETVKSIWRDVNEIALDWEEVETVFGEPKGVTMNFKDSGKCTSYLHKMFLFAALA